MRGHTYLTPRLTGDVLALIAEPPVADPVPLTGRQRQILNLVVEGRRMKEIAGLLDLSPRTVETVKYEMMRALGVHSTAELVRYANPASPGAGRARASAWPLTASLRTDQAGLARLP